MFTRVINEEYAVLHHANEIARLGRRALSYNRKTFG